jgi:hypothetical protein
MDEPIKTIAVLVFGVGGATSAVVLVIMYVVRAVIAKAVQQAGEREIEGLKSTLVKELEREREAFVRDQDRVRAAAAKDLERSKPS